MSRAPAQPLTLATFGHFFAGGHIDHKVAGSPMVGQMYAEFWIPKELRQPYPIVMIHGGSQTGTNFTGTPDGREGWAQYFLRRGYAVYVVDQVARGRAAHWAHLPGTVQPAPLNVVEQHLVAPARFNLWPQARLHTQVIPRRNVILELSDEIRELMDEAFRREHNRDMAARVFTFLERAAATGVAVLVGDPGRAYVPRADLVELARYDIPVTHDLESAEIKATRVWTPKRGRMG